MVLSRLLALRLAALVLAWVAAVLVVAWLVFAGRQVALERAERSTAAFAAVVEQQTARTFQAVHLTLAAVGDAYQLARRPKTNDAAFRQMMARRLKDLPFVRAIFVLGPDGWIVHDTDYPATPQVTLADRPYFRAYQIDPALEPTVWPPLLSRSGSGWFLPVTHAVSRSADFEGVVVAAVQAEQFHEQFRSIGLAQTYLISLFHLDGTLVASYPQRAADVGKRLGELAVFSRLPLEASGSFWTERGMLPGERMVSYRVVQSAPFVVRVSRSKHDALAEWRRTATGAAVAMLALTIFLGWFIVRLARERARRERERERRMQAEKLQALGEFTGGIAHDFANTLNIVAINAALMREQAAPGLELPLAHIERAVRGGTALIERLLSFARRRSLRLERVRLDAWLRAAQPLLAQAAGSRVTLAVEAGAPLAEVLCDTAQLDTALVNLIVNARDAMAGSGRITVSAFPCADDAGAPKALAGVPAPFVCVTVQDSGPGMSEAVRRRALEPFYSTKGEGGTGLGLPQVYGFMQQVGGSMSVDSPPGGGAAIHLFFPVAPADPAVQP
jgi:signal transduction histidine kinase